MPRRDARTLAESGVRLVVVGATEMLTDLPEYAGLTPAIWWNRRYRGMGPTDDIPVILCPEEDLLRLPGENHDLGASVCLHELAHAVGAARSMRGHDFDRRLADAHGHAAENSLDYDGTAKPWFILRSGEERLQDVYGGHVWVLRTTSGELGRVVTETDVHYFEVASRPLPVVDADLRAFLAADAAVLASEPTHAPMSPISDDRVWTLVVNRRSEAVQLHWLDFDGQWIPMDTLPAGGELLRDTRS